VQFAHRRLADRIERSLVRVATVTLLDVSCSARDPDDLRAGLREPPPVASMPLEYATPASRLSDSTAELSGRSASDPSPPAPYRKQRPNDPSTGERFSKWRETAPRGERSSSARLRCAAALDAVCRRTRAVLLHLSRSPCRRRM